MKTNDDTPRLYGRRQGRKLRVRKAGLMETLLPVIRFELPAAGQPFDPAALFARPPGGVWLEVGFGGGEHLAAQAQAHPDIGFIGCEPFINGVAGLLSLIERGRLDNVRILPDDARPLLARLPTASIGRAFVLFADPWPKARHRDRRFIGPANLPDLSRILADGAELRLASDDPGLQTWMLEHMTRHADFDWLVEGPDDWRVRPDDWPPTRYEQKALAAGRTPVFLRFRRKSRPEQAAAGLSP
jgi:tRNA (guanine-N7-)-methyltransferase